MQRKLIVTALLLSFLLILSGCLYPQSKRVENMGSLNSHIENVQQAVNRFKEQSGVFPINNSSMTTPIYEKYVIDFSKIYPNYLSIIPGSAFENGGPYKYVIVNIETDPKVKLLDLRISDVVQKAERAIAEYMRSKGSLPIKGERGPNQFEIDYELLKVKPFEVMSPYTGNSLSLYLDVDGSVYVDYSLDIGILLNQAGKMYDGEDYRDLLIEHTNFVPVRSLPYKMENDRLIPYKQYK